MQEDGEKAVAPDLIVVVRPNGLGHRRLGVAVSSRVGGAVVRNRVKRRFRELFRRRRALLPESVDVVLIGRPGAARSGFEALGGQFERAARSLAARLARS